MSGGKEYLLPAEGVSKDVLKADLARYLGPDAVVISSNEVKNGKRYFLIEASKRPDSSMLDSLKSDTRRWHNTDDYARNKTYSRSRIHDDCVRTSSESNRDNHREAARRPSTVDRDRPLAPINEDPKNDTQGTSRPIRVDKGRSRHGRREEAVFNDMDSAYGSMPSNHGSPQIQYASLSGSYGTPPVSYGGGDSYSANVEAEGQPRVRRGSDEGLSGMYGWRVRRDNVYDNAPTGYQRNPDQK